MTTTDSRAALRAADLRRHDAYYAVLALLQLADRGSPGAVAVRAAADELDAAGREAVSLAYQSGDLEPHEATVNEAADTLTALLVMAATRVLPRARGEDRDRAGTAVVKHLPAAEVAAEARRRATLEAVASVPLDPDVVAALMAVPSVQHVFGPIASSRSIVLHDPVGSPRDPRSPLVLPGDPGGGKSRAGDVDTPPVE